MAVITIDPKKCRKDGLCAVVCQKVFVRETAGDTPKVARPELCHSCGHCVLICPAGAIRHEEHPPGLVHEVRTHVLPSYDQVLEMMRTRRSTRTFFDRQVEKEVIEKVIDAARYAPSAKNSQSTRYMVIQDRDLLRAISLTTAEWLGRVARQLRNPAARAFYRLKGEGDVEEISRWITQFDLILQKTREGRDMVLFGAPALILFHADRFVRLADVNANLALQNATLAASSLGLGSFYTGYVLLACTRERRVSKLLGLPKGHRVYGGLALGYPAVVFSRWVERLQPVIAWK